MKIYILAISLLFTVANASIQNDSTKTDYNFFPIMGYSPDTKTILGAAGNILFKNSKNDNKPSSLSPLFIYTTKHQYSIGLYSDIYSKNKKHHTETAFEYTKFPSSIFAIASDEEENYTPKSLALGAIYSYEFKKNIYAGLRYIYKNNKMDEHESDGVINQLFNKDHNHLSGFGFSVAYDSRNHFFAPSEGFLSKIIWINYGDIIGSKSSFSEYLFEHNHYIGLSEGFVFAYQAMSSFKFGDVPFYELNFLGGENNLRGYQKGKFYGKDKVSIQAELRKEFFYSSEVVVFAGLGNTTNTVEDSFSDFKSSFGIGYRYFLDVENKIPLRIDLAWGENGSSGFYISLLQAF